MYVVSLAWFRCRVAPVLLLLRHVSSPSHVCAKVQVDQLLDEVKEKKIREAAKEAAASYQPMSGAWICNGLVVKVMAEQLPEYYKQKGEIVDIVDQYVAEIEMLDSGDLLRIDQSQLETVCDLLRYDGMRHNTHAMSGVVVIVMSIFGLCCFCQLFQSINACSPDGYASHGRHPRRTTAMYGLMMVCGM